MTLLAQHGWGKSDKIDRGVQATSLSGAILSPRDENPTSLEAYAHQLLENHPELTVFVDPQFYASTIMDPRAGRLSEYDYFRPELTYRSFVNPTRIGEMVREVIDYQLNLRTSHICAPVVAFDSFNDRWNSIAFSMAAESVSYFGAVADHRPLLVSFVINENAFRSNPEFEEFLDIVTDLECDGFYLVIRRTEREYSQGMEQDLLSSILYMTYTLARLNEFEVIYGYCDFLGIPLHAAGATGTACGWTQGLRRFTFGRFEQSSGGRPARHRMSSLPLLNTIFINPELDNIERLDLLEQVLTDTRYDPELNNRPPSAVHWPPDISALHHWQTLADGIAHVTDSNEPADRFDALGAMIRQSTSLYAQLERAGQRLDGASGPRHLANWQGAIEEFRRRTNI